MGKALRFSGSQLRQVRTLIRTRCCNYDGGACLLLDYPQCNICPQWNSGSLNCKWFRYAVLPNNPALEAVLQNAIRPTRRCDVCGTAFVPGSNRARYCPGRAAKRRQSKEAARLHNRYLKSRI